METTTCPHCLQIAGFDPSTGEVYCPNCGVMEPPKYELTRKNFATIQCFLSIPSRKEPWHAGYLEMHLMGADQTTFYHEIRLGRKQSDESIGRIYKDMGLITYFSMN